MKRIKLIFLLACLATYMQISAQDLHPGEIYYDLELLPVGKNDTLSNMQVVLTLTSDDLELLSEIEVESLKNSKKLKVSNEVRKGNPHIKLKYRNYKLDKQTWSDVEELEVKAKLLDGTKIKLKKHPRGSEFTHKVITVEQKRRNLGRYSGPGIVENEKEK